MLGMVHKRKSVYKRKPTGRKRVVTHLNPDLVAALKIRGIKENKAFNDLLEESIRRYLAEAARPEERGGLSGPPTAA